MSGQNTKKIPMALLLIGGLFLLSPMLSGRLNPNLYEGGRSRDLQERANRNTSSVAAMLGEFRTSASDILYVKTERYLHGGVAYAPHVNNRLMSVSGTKAQLDELSAAAVAHDPTTCTAHDHGHEPAPAPKPLHDPATCTEHDHGHEPAPAPKPAHDPATCTEHDHGHEPAPAPKPAHDPATCTEHDHGHEPAPAPKPAHDPATCTEHDHGHEPAPAPKPTHDPATCTEHDHGHDLAPPPKPVHDPATCTAHDHSQDGQRNDLSSEFEEGVMASESDNGMATLIPTEEKDYRSFLGTFHRQVKPWVPPEEHAPHAEGVELLPWFRVMTLSDPHYVRGYAVGGYWLQIENKEAAVDFMMEGVEANPDSFQLHLVLAGIYYDLGRFREDEENNREAAYTLYHQARESYATAAALAIQQRPEDPEQVILDGGDWTGYLENDALASVNMAVMLENKFGEKSQAYELAKKYVTAFPTSSALNSVIRQHE